MSKKVPLELLPSRALFEPENNIVILKNLPNKKLLDLFPVTPNDYNYIDDTKSLSSQIKINRVIISD